MLKVLDRIRQIFSVDTSNSKSTTIPEIESLWYTEKDRKLSEFLDIYHEQTDLPNELENALQSLQDLFELRNRDFRHWELVKSKHQSHKSVSEMSTFDNWHDAKEMAKALRDAYHRDYIFYAKSTEICWELHVITEQNGIFDQDTIDAARDQAILFEANRDQRLTEYWASSIRFDGLQLFPVTIDSEFGYKMLHLEVKKRTANLFLTTSTFIEGVGQDVLKYKCGREIQNQTLNNIIDILAAEEVITAKKRDIMHRVREGRNNVAHNLTERTEFDWTEDLIELIWDCLIVVDLLEYPTELRLEHEIKRKELFDDVKHQKSGSVANEVDWMDLLDRSTDKQQPYGE